MSHVGHDAAGIGGADVPSAGVAALAPMLAWHPQRFLWAVIDGQGWHRTGLLPDGLRPAMQELCPVPLDNYQLVCVPVANAGRAGTLLACAAPIDDLRALDSRVERLTPESVPASLLPPGTSEAQSEALASRLNLLVCALEPQPPRQRRFQRHAVVAATTVVCSLLVAAGLQRRERYWQRLEAAADASLQTLARDTGLSAASLAAADIPGALERDVRSLTLLVRTARAADVPRDATDGLTGLLAAWPLRPEAKLLGLSAAGDRASLSISVAGDAAPLLKDLHAPTGWTMAEPRISTAGAATRLSISLTRTPATADEREDRGALDKPLARSAP
ncbi:MAG: hypothetical protein ACKVS8_06615 [Phycisphaerales bacterium]